MCMCMCMYMCMCVCACVCVGACVCARVTVRAGVRLCARGLPLTALHHAPLSRRSIHDCLVVGTCVVNSSHDPFSVTSLSRHPVITLPALSVAAHWLRPHHSRLRGNVTALPRRYRTYAHAHARTRARAREHTHTQRIGVGGSDAYPVRVRVCVCVCVCVSARVRVCICVRANGPI